MYSEVPLCRMPVLLPFHALTSSVQAFGTIICEVRPVFGIRTWVRFQLWNLAVLVDVVSLYSAVNNQILCKNNSTTACFQGS